MKQRATDNETAVGEYEPKNMNVHKFTKLFLRDGISTIRDLQLNLIRINAGNQ
jgi:hypothetical protein